MVHTPLHRRLRQLGAGLATGVLLVATAGPAAAAHRDYRAMADGTGVSVVIFPDANEQTIEGAGSRAVTVDGGAAAAEGIGLNLVEGSISSVDLMSGSMRDPETGNNCTSPNLPAPLPPLPVEFACSNAEATAGDPASAAAEGFLGDIDLDGDLLSGLVDFLLGAILDAGVVQAVDSAVGTLEDATGPLVGPVAEELAVLCGDELLGEGVSQTAPVFDLLDMVVESDPTGVVGTGLSNLIDALEGAVNTLPEACSSLINVLTDLPELEDILDDVRQALLDALNGLDLVQLTLGGTTSSVMTADGTSVATATGQGVYLELPSLGALVDALEALIPALVDALVGQVVGNVAESLQDIVTSITGLVDDVLAVLMLPDLLDATDPLLTLDAGRAVATASLDIETLDVTTSGTANTAVITLSSAFATLLGEDNTTITVPGGDSLTIAEGTPIESTISVLAVEEITRSVDSESYDLTGTRAGGVTLALFTSPELMGGITVELAVAEAVVGGVPITTPPADPEDPDPAPDPDDPEPAPPMPITGGGLALLGLLAAGGALALGRRRG